ITASVDVHSPPLQIVFRIDASVIPDGPNASPLKVLRNGIRVLDCTDPGPPDPCVVQRMPLGDDVEITVRSSRASDWGVVVGSLCDDGPSPSCATPTESGGATLTI